MLSPLLPTQLNQDEALALIEGAIRQSAAEGVSISLNASQSSLSRFSENQISQNISRNRFKLTATSYFGRQSASASTSELDPEAIVQTLRRSEELARVAPADPEWVPLLEPQAYKTRRPAFDGATAALSPLERGQIVRQVCSQCRQAGAEGSGTLSTSANLKAVGNSLGLRASSPSTEADFSLTARRETGSSWDRRTAWGIDQLPVEEMAEGAIARALASRHPQEVEPGRYPVVLAGAAFAELLSWVMGALEARSADEGRSFMSRTDGAGKPAGNRVGEPLFSSLVRVWRRPSHPLLQGETFFEDGLSNDDLEVIRDGIPQTLAYSRYWAQQQGRQPTGALFPVAMAGSEQTLEDSIAQTERGILVSRAWYVRHVNPRSLEVTGMTRDGTFWIEGGKIAYPIQNLRFNQSLPDMLRDVEAVSQVQRFGNLAVPGVRVANFNFTSVTESI